LSFLDSPEVPRFHPDTSGGNWQKFRSVVFTLSHAAFCGSGTMLAAGLDCGASKVIGLDKEAKYLEIARRRVSGS
jgi:hypothetical protein